MAPDPAPLRLEGLEDALRGDRQLGDADADRVVGGVGDRAVAGSHGQVGEVASATWHFSTERLAAEARGDLFGVERRFFRRVQRGDEWLPAGEYTFKHRLRAAMAGTFRVAPATLQSMYAPEFAAYSSGAALEVAGTN